MVHGSDAARSAWPRSRARAASIGGAARRPRAAGARGGAPRAVASAPRRAHPARADARRIARASARRRRSPPPRARPTRRRGAQARPRGLRRRQRARLARRLRRPRRARVPAHDRGLARLDRRGRAHGAGRRRSRVGLLGAGVWLRERRGHTEASLAAAAVGIAGLFGTLVVAGPVYDLVPDPARVRRRVRHRRASRPALAHALARAGHGLARPARRAVGTDRAGRARRRRHRLPRDRVRGDRRRARVAALDALAAFAFVVTTVQWLRGSVRRRLRCPALIVFGALTAALAFGCESTAAARTRSSIGPRARACARTRSRSCCSRSTPRCSPRAGWERSWTATAVARRARARAHRRSASPPPARAHLPRTRADRRSRSASCSPTSRSRRSRPACRSCSAGPSPRCRSPPCSAPARAAGRARKLVDAVDRAAPDDEAARRADRILAIGRPARPDRALGLPGTRVRRAPSRGARAAPFASRHGAGRRRRARRRRLGLRPGSPGRRAYRIWLDALALAAVAHFTGPRARGRGADRRARRRGARARRPRRAATTTGRPPGPPRPSPARPAPTRSARSPPPDALLDGLDAPLAAAGGARRRRRRAVRGQPRALAHRGRAAVCAPSPRVTLLYLASVEVVTAGRAGRSPARRCSACCGRSRASAR